ncbi:hypothetical protein Cni_G22726 [Canna indica]|uniref:non-specific serine/threonine protein kinase n=1 Tax=Canna indica TaxID=4628 RepID=A0AAQ3KX81_9LILI|nr:hypothetical protein Cni_G22726 [Canna indica]
MSWGAPPAVLRLPAAVSAALLLLFILQLPTARSDKIVTDSNGTFFYSRSDFESVDNSTTDLLFFKDAKDNQGALQLTPDTTNNPSQYLVDKSGRVFLVRPFKLWEEISATSSNTSDGKHVASFNTTFSVNIYRPDNSTPGEGMAFIISSYLSAPPPGSEGGYLGLTNATLDGNASNHFVAVELDTVNNASLDDPNNNHVGLDTNGVKSRASSNLSFPLATDNQTAANYTVWVDYDGGARHVWVYMDFQGRPKPAKSVLDAQLDLSQFLLQKYSYFGFSGSTGKTYQLNCVLSWNLTVELLPEEKSGMAGWKLGVIITSVLFVVVSLIAGIWVLYSRRRRVRDASGSSAALVLGTLRSLPGTPREFEFKELNKATSNFDEKMKLGKGGFGEVYRGVLPGENKEVAVKKFSRGSSGPDDFLKELTIINRLRHKHLVPLVGWCHTNGMLLLVYDYMPNGSLDHHLFGGDDKPVLSWERRYNVVTGVASALHYLHDEYDQRVVHRDLKASNIMLDANFNARLGDFGLARALETDKTSYAELEMGGVPGTMGYIAPECFHTGKATRESDVFGFGAVVLEVVCGRRPRCDIAGFKFLSDWAWKLHQEGRILEAVDPRLGAEYDGEDARRLLLLALACSHPTPAERPKTEAVVQIVSKAVPPPEVPDFKPAFVWPSGPSEAEGALATSSRLTTSSAVTSSYYASSAAGWSSQSVSREGQMGIRDNYSSMV